MHISVQFPSTPLPTLASSNTTTIGGRRRKNEPTTPLPPRAQPSCALCEREGNPTKRCPTLPELRNMIQLSRETTFLTTPPSTSTTTMKSSNTHNKGLQIRFACAICSEYGHYSNHFPALSQFLQILSKVRQTSSP
jgi:transposase-like protein